MTAVQGANTRSLCISPVDFMELGRIEIGNKNSSGGGGGFYHDPLGDNSSTLR